MARIAVVGLAKSGTTGLWSALVKALPARYLQFFEGQYLPTRYNKYIGRKNPDKSAPDVIDKQIIGPDFHLSAVNFFDHVVWLVRDPRDRLVSYILYRHFDHRFDDDAFVSEQLRLLEKKEMNPRAVNLRDLESRLNLPDPTDDSAFFWGDQKKWSTLQLAVTKGQALVFRYEDFVDGQFSEIENRLGLKISKAKHVPKQFERVVRSKSHGFWRDWFTKEDVEHYRPLFEPFLLRYGYDNNWDSSNDPRINPAHGSFYARRIVNERRASEGLPAI